MVGYLIGLGDRHPSNLMLQQKTGRVIHIDYGECFETAMHRQRYPEKMPFRLTRMLTTALGVTGVEGDFRATCEKTLQALRDNKDVLLAMLEVFVRDPLITWRLMRGAGTTIAQGDQRGTKEPDGAGPPGGEKNARNTRGGPGGEKELLNSSGNNGEQVGTANSSLLGLPKLSTPKEPCSDDVDAAGERGPSLLSPTTDELFGGGGRRGGGGAWGKNEQEFFGAASPRDEAYNRQNPTTAQAVLTETAERVVERVKQKLR